MEIFLKYDKLYIFDGTNIQEGPNNISTKLGREYYEKKEIKFPHPKDPNDYIVRSISEFNINHIFEIQEESLIYTPKLHDHSIYSINLDNLEDVQIKSIYQIYKDKEFGDTGKIDIILHSEYYPENVYLIINFGYLKPSASDLRIHNYQDFIKGLCNKGNAVDNLKISNTENVFGMCEYNEQYLLLDTIEKNIYIFDIIKKQKVAICAPTKEGVQPGRPPKGKFARFFENLSEPHESIYKYERTERINSFYRKIHKLKDGKILVLNRQIKVVDVAMQKVWLGFYASGCHVYTGEYVVCLLDRSQIAVIKIFKDD